MSRNVSPSSNAWLLAAAGWLLATAAAGGGGPICLNCNPSSSPTPSEFVTVTGNVGFVDDPGTNLAVVICVDDATTTNPQNCEHAARVSVDSTTNDFTLSTVLPGSEQVFFTQNPVSGVPSNVAKLSDPTEKLRAVSAGETVNIQDAQISFVQGTATAVISVEAAPTATPTPATTPTPTPG